MAGVVVTRSGKLAALDALDELQSEHRVNPTALPLPAAAADAIDEEHAAAPAAARLPRPPAPPLADERAGGRVRPAASAPPRRSTLIRTARGWRRRRRGSATPRTRRATPTTCACFPELELYTVGGGGGTSSGRSSADEYKRTVGALMAVYWFCRLHLPHTSESEGLDGQRGFCFGCSDDATWRPPAEKEVERMRDSLAKVEAAADSDGDGLPERAAELRKRLMFRAALQWGDVEALLIDARILRRASGIADGPLEVDVPRATAMLALTAIHDIMKVQSLLPSVLPADNGYCGYEAGTTIHDHDVALGYVLEKDPTALPCFDALDEPEQRAIRFTQSKMGFNHGWLVQAEAPPGALFSSFKKLIDDEGVDSADIAFYFVHWLTDLAGAVPTPLEGSTQFAVRFPQPVLASFLRSIPLVQRLATKSETELFEAFLVEWWPNDKLGPPPEGDDAIALMRLMVQVQTPEDQRKLREAYGRLPSESRVTLAREMALTAVDGQVHQRTPCWGSAGPRCWCTTRRRCCAAATTSPRGAADPGRGVRGGADDVPDGRRRGGPPRHRLGRPAEGAEDGGRDPQGLREGHVLGAHADGELGGGRRGAPAPRVGGDIARDRRSRRTRRDRAAAWSAAPLLSSQRVPGLSPEGSFAKRRGRRLSVAVS